MVVFLAVTDSKPARAAARNAEVSHGGSTLGGQTLSMALQLAHSRPSVLQAEVLRNTVTSMHPDDPHGVQLHDAMPFLLEGTERGPGTKLGRNRSTRLRRAGKHR